MKLYEQEETKKPDTINYDPIMRTPHMETLPLSSTGRTKRHNEMYQSGISESTPEHITYRHQYKKLALKKIRVNKQDTQEVWFSSGNVMKVFVIKLF